jgi:hypothetical protein
MGGFKMGNVAKGFAIAAIGTVALRTVLSNVAAGLIHGLPGKGAKG